MLVDAAPVSKVVAAVFSKDDVSLYIIAANNAIFQVDVQSGAVVQSIAWQQGLMSTMDITADGVWVLTAADDDSVHALCTKRCARPCHQRLKHAAECRSMPQHLILGPVGGGFEACRSTPQHTENSAQTKILIPSFSTCAVENDGTLVDRCSGCGIQVPDSISRAVNTMSYRQR